MPFCIVLGLAFVRVPPNDPVSAVETLHDTAVVGLSIGKVSFTVSSASFDATSGAVLVLLRATRPV